MNWREKLVLVALGKQPADLVIQNGLLVNVNTREVYPSGLAIMENRIAAVGDVNYAIGSETKVFDANGMYLIPGLIDSHMHTESSGVTLTQLARLLIPRGVTSIMYAHEIANVLGKAGMDLVRQESKLIPLRIYFETPTSVPWAPGLEMPATILSVEDVQEMLLWDESVSLGESDYFDVLNLDKEIFSKVEFAHSHGKPVNGHAAMVSGKQLMAVAGAAFDDDHENYSPEEVLEKLRLGMKVMLREANLPDLASAITQNQIDTRNILLCIDDKLANVINQEGGVDNTVRVAIANGIDPITAIQFATINPANHFGIDQNLGSLSPGKLADILISDSLEKLTPRMVFVDGNLVAREGRYLSDVVPYKYPVWSKQTVHLKKDFSPEDFKLKADIPSGDAQVRVLKVSHGGWVKTWEIEEFPISNGELIIPQTNKYNRIAVIERHGIDGHMGIGLISGVDLKRGAIASSVAHDCHNITVVGADTTDMAICVNALSKMGGGFVAVADGEILAQVEFEIGGLISDEPYEVVADKLNQFENVIRKDFGFAPDVVFVIFNFIALQSSPFEAAITDRGLIDTYSRKVVPLIVSHRKQEEIDKR